MFNFQNLKIDYIPVHWQTQYKNQVLDWLPCDTLENFEKNLNDPDNKQYLEQHNWTEPGAFKYCLNSHGFRTAEPRQNSNSIVGLGCSHTCGVGLPDSDVWISQLSRLLELDCVNLGVGGASLDTVFRIASYWLNIIKPKIAVLLCPPIHRFEIRQDCNDLASFLPEMILNNEDSIVCKRWWKNDENSYFNAHKNILAIQKLCYELDIKIYVYATEELRTVDLARDLMHHGPRAHLAFAEKVFADIRGNVDG